MDQWGSLFHPGYNSKNSVIWALGHRERRGGMTGMSLGGGGWTDGLGRFGGWERAGDGMVGEASEPASVMSDQYLAKLHFAVY